MSSATQLLLRRLWAHGGAFIRQHIRLVLTAAIIIASAVTVGVVRGVIQNAAAAVHVSGGAGATLPYTELQAEDAATNGTIIGPDTTFTHLAAEASGRRAVTLTRGQYVEFTLPTAANAITVRYSIPDSADGVGLTAQLSIAINGTHLPTQTLALTSRYSWLYGGYPFTNTPQNGLPQHFYDEAHLLLGEMAAGTKVRLQVDAADTAPAYTIDLADFEEVAPPHARPAGYLSITDPSGIQDATQAIQQALTAGAQQGKGVWIPAGTFAVTRHLIVDNVTLAGAGPWYASLSGDGVGVYGKDATQPSHAVHLADFAIVGRVRDRVDNAPLNGVGGALAHSTITDLWIEHTKVGMWFDGPFGGLTITGCRIRDTTADGLNFHDGITDSSVTQTTVRNTGDDGLAMWSEHHADVGDAFDADTVQLPILANDIALYGGTDNRITNNRVEDSLTQGGGIQVGNRFNAVPLKGTTTIAHNTFIRTGCYDPSFGFGIGALWFYALDSPMAATIVVSQAEITDSVNEAIQFIGSADITNVRLDHVQIRHAGTFAVQVQTTGSARFTAVVASGLGVSGIYNCGVAFTITTGVDNTGWEASTCGFPPAA